jgi:hypothetical protein
MCIVPGTKVAPFPSLMWGWFFTACGVFIFSARALGAIATPYLMQPEGHAFISSPVWDRPYPCIE